METAFIPVLWGTDPTGALVRISAFHSPEQKADLERRYTAAGWINLFVAPLSR